MIDENLKYVLDITKNSKWIRTTPGEAALSQPYFCTEAGHFEAGSRFSTSRSAKDSYLLFYTLGGKGYIKQSDNQITLEKGEIAIIDCREPQEYGTAKDQDHWDHYWIHFDGKGVDSIVSMINHGGISKCLFREINVRSTFEPLMEMMQSEDIESILEIGLIIHRLLVRVMQRSAEHGDGQNDKKNIIRDAAEYIRTNSRQQIGIKELCAMTNMSKAYLCRWFKQYMGTTPYNYLLRCRITDAKDLLAMTDLPVGEIAEKVGFNDETNFATRFLQISGMSPSQYRKEAH